MAPNEHFYPTGSLRSDPWECVVDSTISDWKYTGLRVATLIRNQFLELENCGLERILIPLEGSFEITFWVEQASEKVQNLQGLQEL